MTGTFQLSENIEKRDRFGRRIKSFEEIKHELFSFPNLTINFKEKKVIIPDPIIVLSHPLFTSYFERSRDLIELLYTV